MKLEASAAILLAGLLATPVFACPTQLRVQVDRLLVTVQINGNPTEALLDSGAEMTFIDTRYAGQIGLATAGSEVVKGTGGTDEVSFAEEVDIEVWLKPVDSMR